MKTGEIMELDRDIVRIEKELAGLYKQRWGLLEREMQSSKARAESFLGTSGISAGRGAAAPAAAPVVTRTQKKTAQPKTKRGKKRTRMATEEVETRLIETVKSAGSAGISLIDISKESGLKYQTAAKKLKEMGDRFAKKGELKEARYFLKA